MDVIELNDGNALLKLGFGTYCLKSDVCEGAVKVAIKAGYRSIDTATIYRNEEAIGKAIRESGTFNIYSYYAMNQLMQP